MIIHGRLKQEGRMFVIGSHQFENLNLMVAYYNKHEFYHGVFLKYPVNAEAIELYAKDVSHAPSGCYLDLQNIDNKVSCCFVDYCRVDLDFFAETFGPSSMLIRRRRRSRTIVSVWRYNRYRTKRRRILVRFFFIPSIFEFVTIFFAFFRWKGVYKNKQGMVPVDHVEILPANYNFIAGAASDGLNMGLGLIELARSSLGKLSDTKFVANSFETVKYFIFRNS